MIPQCDITVRNVAPQCGKAHIPHDKGKSAEHKIQLEQPLEPPARTINWNNDDYEEILLHQLARYVCLTGEIYIYNCDMILKIYHDNQCNM